ncbi:hypothetical protein SDC9_89897 [bioreactor metagenome]|uniref:Uncharacterized protein n=1 Tax=bioreactor metagenome TaxID=1076179 RepID=A0A645A071_9ZZZZ
MIAPVTRCRLSVMATPTTMPSCESHLVETSSSPVVTTFLPEARIESLTKAFVITLAPLSVPCASAVKAIRFAFSSKMKTRVPCWFLMAKSINESYETCPDCRRSARRAIDSARGSISSAMRLAWTLAPVPRYTNTASEDVKTHPQMR